MSRFIYSVIRYVPDAASGEFVNIGAIVGSEEQGRWALKNARSLTLARHLGRAHSKDTLPQAIAFVQQLASDVDSSNEQIEEGSSSENVLTEAWLMQRHERLQNIVQLSRPTPIIAEDAEEALSLVFDEFIVDHDEQPRDYANKATAMAALRRAYAALGLQRGQQTFERIQVRGAHHPADFDFGVANGRAVQLAQTWSFQVPAQDKVAEAIRAWGWSVGDIRHSGGQVSMGARTVVVPADVDIEVLYVPPRSADENDFFKEASSVFGALQVKAAPLAEAAAVGRRAKDLLAA